MKNIRLCLMALLVSATFALTGCGGGGVTTSDVHQTSQPSSVAASTDPCADPASTVLLCQWSNGIVMANAGSEISQIGLPSVYQPKDTFRLVAVQGIAPIGNFCVVVLNRYGATDLNHLSLIVVKQAPGDKQQTPIATAQDILPERAKIVVMEALPSCSNVS